MSISVFIGFVLLNEVKFDRDKFLKDLKEDWKIILNLGEENKEKDMLVGNIDDIMVVVVLMFVFILDNEVVESVKINYRWKDVIKVVEEYKVYIIVLFLGEFNLVDGVKLYLKIILVFIK